MMTMRIGDETQVDLGSQGDSFSGLASAGAFVPKAAITGKILDFKQWFYQ